MAYTAEQEALAAIVRQEVEDLYSALETRFYLNHGTPYTDEGTQFVEDGVPYTTTAQVLTMIPVGMRRDYRTVNVAGVEYWFISGNLVQKNNASIADHSLLLNKLVNIGALTLIGNNTNASGEPLALTVAQVKEMLGLTGIDFSKYVEKVNGKSLVLDTLIALIHAPGSDDQNVPEQVQTDWDETDPSSMAFLKNKKPFLTEEYDWKIKSIIDVASLPPTPPTAAELLSNKPWTAYGTAGVQVYKLNGSDYVPDPDVPILTTNIVWKNTAENLTDGVFNRCSVWSALDATPGQYIGFGREIVVPTAKTYYIGVAADNYMSLEVNNVLIKSFPSGDTIEDHYTTWHLLPVFLNAGVNIIHMIGYNDYGLAAFGAEIYDATLPELQAVSSVSALNALTIFSTKSLIGSYVEEGNFGTGYTCQPGYTLVNRNGVLSCDKVVYGGIPIQKHDLVEFRWGTGTEFSAEIDPLDSSHKFVNIPRGSGAPLDIVLPYANTVQGRCNGVIEIPDGWTIAAAPDNEYDLLITHNLNRRFVSATITAVIGTTEQLLQNNGAYAGITAESRNVLRILGLTEEPNTIAIYLIFT